MGHVNTTHFHMSEISVSTAEALSYLLVDGRVPQQLQGSPLISSSSWLNSDLR
jgi:hypothetical protein